MARPSVLSWNEILGGVEEVSSKIIIKKLVLYNSLFIACN